MYIVLLLHTVHGQSGRRLELRGRGRPARLYPRARSGELDWLIDERGTRSGELRFVELGSDRGKGRLAAGSEIYIAIVQARACPAQPAFQARALVLRGDAR